MIVGIVQKKWTDTVALMRLRWHRAKIVFYNDMLMLGVRLTTFAANHLADYGEMVEAAEVLNRPVRGIIIEDARYEFPEEPRY